MPRIETYSFGRIQVDGTLYSTDIIVCPDRVFSGWWRREGHCLYPEDMKAMLKAQPEVIIIGRGKMGVMKIPDSTKQWVEDHGVTFIAEPTPQAVLTYNELSLCQRAVGGFHLTC